MSSMSDYLENAVAQHVLVASPFASPTAVYLALFTSPTADDGSGSEVLGGGYLRQPVEFHIPYLDGAAVSFADVVFSDMPPATVTHAALFDSATGGNMLLHAPLTAPKVVPNGAPLTFPAGDIDAAFA